ncbi:MAG: A/G-specific adenine glycosylase [Cognaticolwellia sp.]|jgi:A/G-specific adenine glycosylase
MNNQALLNWYRGVARPLPWRAKPADPYGILLSEIMAQQTRIETMLPYWERFMSRWPTVQDLAGAKPEEVLGEWAGLGYYSRARNLHKAAKVVSELGKFPDNAQDLRALPGVGPYTAGAIASIAFDQDAALVDGNVERVLCRFHRIEEDPRTPMVKRRLWALAETHIPKGEAGDHNQALMELGATVCTPRNPSCSLCPLSVGCAGQDIAAVLPNKPRKQKAPEVRAACVGLEREGSILLCRRPESGLLGGLWELPSVDLELKEKATETSLVEQGLEERLGMEVQLLRRLGQVRHIFTHRKLTQTVWQGRASGDLTLRYYEAAAWFDPQDLGKLPLSKLALKTLAVLEQPDEQLSLL